MKVNYGHLNSIHRLLIVFVPIYFPLRPFWLSPRQVMVVPVSPKFDDYATQVTELIGR